MNSFLLKPSIKFCFNVLLLYSFPIIETTTIATGGSYGNTTVDGYIYGVGYKSAYGSGNAYYKLEGTHTEFDTLSINSSTTDKGDKITADLDVTKLTFALGFNF